MKSLLAILLLFLAIQVRAATPSFQDFTLSQFRTNGNKLSIKTNAFLSSPVTENLIATNTGFILNATNGNLSVSNSASVNTLTASNTATFNAKAVMQSNYVTGIFYRTNTMSTITIDVGKATESLATNNAIVFTGYAGIDGTNNFTFSRIITNTAGSAAVKPITFPVGSLMLSSPFTNVVYNTNQGVLSGWISPTHGTNITWTGF